MENGCMKKVVSFAFIVVLFLSAAAKNLSADPADTAKEFVEGLNCPKVSAGDNKMGLSIKSIRKDGDDYIVSWNCDNPGINGNETLVFVRMRFFDPADFSKSYTAFTVKDGRLNYAFKSGDEISYKTFRFNFRPASQVVYLYFDGLPASTGAPANLITPPLFFTILLGDNPIVYEDVPRLAMEVFKKYLPE
jgi:hypothetical protein